MQNKSASILILTYNSERTIQDLLSKIDIKKYEVIIVDSSSTDDTIKICQKFDCKIVTIDKSDFNQCHVNG